MWRTSWLSREVIVLPAFIAVVALWLVLHARTWRPACAARCRWRLIVLALLLWWCTAMIYACLKFIQEWATPLTLVNYLLIGMASGLSLYARAGAARRPGPLPTPAAGWALILTVVAGGARRVAGPQRPAQAEVDACSPPPACASAESCRRSMGMTGRRLQHARVLPRPHAGLPQAHAS